MQFSVQEPWDRYSGDIFPEIIMFGLTFKQLAYAFSFGLFAIIIFFKTDWNVYVKIVLTTIIVFLAVLFMFFNFARFLKSYLQYLKFIKAKDGSQKMKQFVGIKEIKDNLMINSEGKKIAVIKVEPMKTILQSYYHLKIMILQRSLNVLKHFLAVSMARN